MGKNIQNFSDFEAVNPPTGSYEHQLKMELDKKIQHIENLLNELKTEYENIFY